ncbi:MAG: hypothetical protein GF332_03865 [Candidatus Moranbacteria bacterium]|nr:hypothetical protein [Candidatus Moranbacteria bacterium]
MDFLLNLPFLKTSKTYSIIEKLNQSYFSRLKIITQGGKNSQHQLPSWEIEKKILFLSYCFHQNLSNAIQKSNFLSEEEKYRQRYLDSIPQMYPEYTYMELEEEKNKVKQKPAEEIRTELRSIKEKYLEADVNEREVIKKAFPENIQTLEGKTQDKLHKFLVSQNEILNCGIDQIFANLVSKGFATKTNGAIAITEQGLEVGELLWYLYRPKKIFIPNRYVQLFGEKPTDANREVEQSLIKLEKQALPHLLVKFKFFIFNLTIFYLILSLSFVLIYYFPLSSSIDQNAFSYNFQDSTEYQFLLTVIKILFLLPGILFFLNLLISFFYRRFILTGKFEKVERLINEFYIHGAELQK